MTLFDVQVIRGVIGRTIAMRGRETYLLYSGNLQRHLDSLKLAIKTAATIYDIFSKRTI